MAWVALGHTREDEEVLGVGDTSGEQLLHLRSTGVYLAKNERATLPCRCPHLKFTQTRFPIPVHDHFSSDDRQRCRVGPSAGRIFSFELSQSSAVLTAAPPASRGAPQSQWFQGPA